MDTDMLIDELTANLRPVPANAASAVLRKGLLGGGGVAFAAVLLWPSLGVRHDIAPALLTAAFWIKALYTLSIASLGFLALDRLSRPDAERAHWVKILWPPLSVLLAITAMRWGRGSSRHRRGILDGRELVAVPIICRGTVRPGVWRPHIRVVAFGADTACRSRRRGWSGRRCDGSEHLRASLLGVFSGLCLDLVFSRACYGKFRWCVGGSAPSALVAPAGVPLRSIGVSRVSLVALV